MSANKRGTESSRPVRKKASGTRFSKVKKLLASPVVTMVLFGLAVVMLLGSTVGGARAVLTYTSDYYRSSVEMFNIGVSLYEQCGANEPKKVSWRDYDVKEDGYWDDARIQDAEGNSLLTDLLAAGEEIQPGRRYDEKLYVVNTGDIDQYVRVTIYKYWVGADANEDGQKDKLPALSPGLIDLNLINCGTSEENQPWIIDETSSTKERTVLYYRNILKAVGEDIPEGDPSTMSVPLCDYLRIDPGVADQVTQTVTKEEIDGKTYTTITTTYVYNGVEFRIKAQVDAVQTHSAREAIWSAWGRDVEIDSNGSLTSVK